MAAVFFLALLSAAGPAKAATLSGDALVSALRQGGYVIVMRHASSPAALPDAAAAEPDNSAHERQLDTAGKDSARAMGEALKRLRLPVGDVLSSPTYRALQTVRFAQLGNAKTFAELGDAGQNMQAQVENARSAFLRGKSAEAPRAGTEAIVVTHGPNIAAAFGKDADGLADGEAMVFHPDGHGGAELVARVKIGDWPGLAGPK